MKTKTLTKKPVEKVLSPRKLQIVELLDRGLSRKLIADTLGISISTVGTNINSLHEKYKEHNSHGLIYKLRKKGLYDGEKVKSKSKDTAD